MPSVYMKVRVTVALGGREEFLGEAERGWAAAAAPPGVLSGVQANSRAARWANLAWRADFVRRPVGP